MDPSISRREFLAGLGAVAATGTALGARATTEAGVKDDITALDAPALSAAIRAREVSCVEVMGAYLARIEACNPRHNAIVSLAPPERLLAEARVRDAELARGEWRGWMHGMPHAVKDLADVQGFPNTMGSPLFRARVSTQDSVFVERIRAAGAIFIGKTNVPEFGAGSQSYNPVFGVTRNAWDPSRTAGGSSGGAAVGLALHMLPVADGSDMMGSLRNPAGWNNVVGLRPSQGRVPGEEPDYLHPLGVSGPMGRTVAGAARLLATMAGYDPRDPLSLPQDPAVFAGSLASDPRGLRIGWLGDYDGYLPMEAGVLALCRKTLDTFATIGCVVDEARPDFAMERLWQTWLTLRHWAFASSLGEAHAQPALRAQLKPELVWEVEGGLRLDALAVSAAGAARAAWYRALLALFERFDFLVLPSAQVFPFAAETHWPAEIAGRRMDTYHRWMEVVIGGTLGGCPVLNLPAGFGAAGLPMGIQVIGRVNAELDLLKLGAAYEQAAGWHRRAPPV